MSKDKRPDPRKDTSKRGREEEVIKNTSRKKTGSDVAPVKGAPNDKRETEGERRFKEGLVNNSDTDE